jgi:hypothetical protein
MVDKQTVKNNVPVITDFDTNEQFNLEKIYFGDILHKMLKYSQIIEVMLNRFIIEVLKKIKSEVIEYADEKNNQDLIGRLLGQKDF